MGKNLIKIQCRNIFIIFCLILYSSVCISEGSLNSGIKKTNVIEDRGGVSTSKYLPKKNTKSIRPAGGNSLHSSYFPIVTKSMSVGRVDLNAAEKLNLTNILRPMFIIGFDAVSMDWLKANKSYLSERKAIGLVVNVENADQFNTLKEIAGEKIALQPTNGDSISENLQIHHYPFYIDKDGVMK